MERKICTPCTIEKNIVLKKNTKESQTKVSSKRSRTRC